MNIIINQKNIKRNKTIGSIASLASIIILITGLILNLNPTQLKTIISYGALILGFTLSQIATYYITRFGRSPRFDEIIADNLTKLDNDYTFYVYSTPIPMLIVGPYGLWIPIPVSVNGEIYYDKKWKKHGSVFSSIFGQGSIGRPEFDVQRNEKEIKDFLGKHVEEGNLPPIKSILVTIHPKSSIGNVDDAPTPIVEVSALRRTIRRYDRKHEEDGPLEVISEINQLLKD